MKQILKKEMRTDRVLTNEKTILQTSATILTHLSQNFVKFKGI